MDIQIDEAKCLKCGRCATVCPSAVFQWEKGCVPSVARPETCISCGHCMDVCSGAAIRHESFPEGTVHEVRKDLLPTPEAVMELIRSRRSNRTITDRPIPDAVLRDIQEAARYAPTAENKRLVRLTVLTQREDLQRVEDTTMKFFLRLAKLLMNPVVRPLTRLCLPDLYAEAPELGRFRRRWESGELPCLCNGTVLIAFSAPKGYDFGWQDCNLAYENASLMAESHGVSQVYMGLVQTAMKFMGNKKTAKVLGLPKGHRLYGLMSLGIPAFRYPRYTER